MTDWAHFKLSMWQTFEASDAEATKALYARIAALGRAGEIAVNLLRATKRSARAKTYGGRGSRAWRRQAYDTKGWAMDNLCRLLAAHAAESGVVAWGWGVDPKQPVHKHVLYVELPTGQVSFHAEARGEGPDYPKAWDGIEGKGGTRIIDWCAPMLWRHERAAADAAPLAGQSAALIIVDEPGRAS